MGYVVLHLEKAAGSETAMSAHIERTIKPKNADETRTYLNRELIAFPEGVHSRTGAIQHRLDTAGLQRKISKNQVRAIRVMLSGSADQMKQLEASGQLTSWCYTNLNWLKETYGNENLVSAVLHMDESTPHIHATVVPIVTGERRKAKLEQEKRMTINTTGKPKKKYKKKNPNQTRLCADDVMTRDKLKTYQNSYAQAMQVYGLQRGVEGSKAKHIGTSQYYRELYMQTSNLQENIETLLGQQQEAKQALDKVKLDVNKERLKNAATEMGASLMDGVGSLLGVSKTKRLQNELEELRTENVTIKVKMGNEITQLKNHIHSVEAEHKTTIGKLSEQLDKIFDYFPNIKELLRIENSLRHLGFGKELIKSLLDMKPVQFTGELHSSEHKRHFKTQSSVAEIKPSSTDPNRLKLTIDSLSNTNWFKQKQQELLKSIGINVKQGRGRKL